MRTRAFALAAAALAAMFGIASLVAFIALDRVQAEAESIRQEREEGLALLDALRQSTDDLTRMARLYAVTGDERYNEYFQRILDIRDGGARRPIDYGWSYWDLVIATGREPHLVGEAAALSTLAAGGGLTESERVLFEESKANSDSLVEFERDAMGTVTEAGLAHARELLHGGEYHRLKARIMTPLDSLLGAFDARTAAELADRNDRRDVLRTVLYSFLALTIALSAAATALAASDARRAERQA